MRELSMSVLATIPVVVPYASLDSAGALADPTGTTPEFAFTDLDTDPIEGDWSNGSWQTWSSVTKAVHLADTIVNTPYRAGFDVVGATLGVGKHMAWLRVGTVVDKVGQVRVYQ